MSDPLLRHGGALDRVKARFPDAPAPWIDLSTGINPWPYPVGGDVAAGAVHLPTAAAEAACREAAARAFGVGAAAVVLTPGTELAIRLLPTVLRARRALILKPTYGDHARAWAAAGVEVSEVSDPLDPDVLKRHGDVDLTVLCHPNNPDGRMWTRGAIREAADVLAARGGHVVVDEAYADLTPQSSCAPDAEQAPGLIVLRSFGKFYGLAGLRLGAVLAPPPILAALRERLGVWAVSGPALAVGAAAYADEGWAAATRRRLAGERAALDAVFAGAGLNVVGGTDLFRFVEIADAKATWTALARAGVYGRRFDLSGRHLRIGLPESAAARARLEAALSAR